MIPITYIRQFELHFLLDIILIVSIQSLLNLLKLQSDNTETHVVIKSIKLQQNCINFTLLLYLIADEFDVTDVAMGHGYRCLDTCWRQNGDKGNFSKLGPKQIITIFKVLIEVL